MNIKATQFPAYNKSIGKATQSPVSTQEKTSASFETEVKNGKSDKVMISQNATNQSSIARISKPIANEVNSVDNSDKIKTLKEQIANGTYHVSTEELTDKLLSRWSADA